MATWASLNFDRFIVSPRSQAQGQNEKILAQSGPIFQEQVTGLSKIQIRLAMLKR